MSAPLPSKVTTASKSPAINAPQSATVVTPSGTLNITLSPAPAPKIPFIENPTAWVPIVTLLGVIITIIAGWKKTKMELRSAANEARIERNQSRDQADLERQHAAEQAHLERLTQARREVYLEVVSEVVAAQSALALLPAKDIQKLDVQEDMRGLIVAVSKVSLFGEIKTVEMSWELLTRINQGLFRLMALLIPYSVQKAEADDHDQRVSFQISEIHRLAAEMKAIRETSNNAEELTRLSNIMEFRRADMETHGAAAVAAKKRLLELLQSFGDTTIEESYEIGQKVDELVVCIREELSLPTSLERFRALRSSTYAAAKTATTNLRETLDNGENNA